MVYVKLIFFKKSLYWVVGNFLNSQYAEYEIVVISLQINVFTKIKHC